MYIYRHINTFWLFMSISTYKYVCRPKKFRVFEKYTHAGAQRETASTASSQRVHSAKQQPQRVHSEFTAQLVHSEFTAIWVQN